jgi:putative solute:sodium symporter small subunit
MPDRNARFQWIGTKQLMLIMLALWLLFAMAVHLFVVPLNRIIIPYLDLPLGFFMAAQGALLAFVVMAFVFSSRQEHLEHDRFSDGGHS